MHEFIFHGVGQGLFFEGGFYNFRSSKKFTLVYDCGSNDLIDLDNSINDFKTRNNKIDMLVISHFDFDHISGIRKLLNNNLHITQLIIPYMTDLELLMLATSPDNDISEDWYLNFINSPLEFLISYENIEEIVIIYPNEGVEQQELFEDNSIIDEHSRRAKKHSHNKFMSKIEFGIMFKFFNYKVSDEKRQFFYKKLKENGIEINRKSIRALLQDRDTIKEIKKSYEKVSKYHNNVSLTMLYMLNDSPNSLSYELPRVLPQEYNTSGELDYFSVILTGDISINYKRKHHQLYTHYKTDLSKVKVVQLPHHGSMYNWNKDLLKKVRKDAIFVASFGLGNRHGHPSKSVVKDVKTNFYPVFNNWSLKCRIT